MTMGVKDTSEKMSVGERLDREYLETVKLVYPTDNAMQMLVSQASDEEMLRDADLAATAIAFLIMNRECGLAAAVTRLVGYVCRTMGPDSGESYAQAMSELFETLDDFPAGSVPLEQKWRLIRQMSASAHLLLTAERTLKNLAVAETLWKRERDNPDATKPDLYKLGKGELALFTRNPLKTNPGK